MPAFNTIGQTMKNRARRFSTRSGGFTLTELLVVIALIALLVGLLLAALNVVMRKTRETTTISTMTAFSNAASTFQQEHGFYPGAVPEHILANDPRITGTENAMLHLMGGVTREEDVSPTIYTAAPGEEYTFSTPTGGTYSIKVDVPTIGQGPSINGSGYAPYFAPGDRVLQATEGQWDVAGDSFEAPTNPASHWRIPDVLDAWGQPIIYLRRVRPQGVLVAADPDDNPQFDYRSMKAYLLSTSLGELGGNQMVPDGGDTPMSILNNDSYRIGNLERILETPSISNQARGAFMLLSAGADGVFFSRFDGLGSPGTPVDDMSTSGPKVIDEYDDLLRYGGG